MSSFLDFFLVNFLLIQTSECHHKIYNRKLGWQMSCLVWTNLSNVNFLCSEDVRGRGRVFSTPPPPPPPPKQKIPSHPILSRSKYRDIYIYPNYNLCFYTYFIVISKTLVSHSLLIHLDCPFPFCFYLYLIKFGVISLGLVKYPQPLKLDLPCFTPGIRHL